MSLNDLIPVAEPLLGEKELENVIEAVKSGWISSKGKFIPEFEENFAKYCNCKYSVATSSGTTALHLALTTLGISRDDEVIVPDFTFIATANAVIYCNAKPIFVDSHPEYWCINPDKIEKKITKNTKAIIPVHLYGHPCDMGSIMEIAKKYGLYVIEDAAESLGAEYKGKKVGSFGDISCFSFYGNKIITTGEGGMCVTDKKELAEKMRILRDHGMNPNKKFWHDVIGFSYRMTNMQAAVGLAQLTKIEKFIKKKRQIAKWYEDGLYELVKKGKIKLHPETPWAKCIYWMYSILIEDEYTITRDTLMKKLEEKGVETRKFFYPIHTLPPYRLNKKFKISEDLSKRGINLPTSVKLDKDTTNTIIRNIDNIINFIKEPSKLYKQL